MTKYCEDCALFFLPKGMPDASGAWCLFPRPSMVPAEMVSRSLARPRRSCLSERGMRDHEDSCGPEAKWFQPKNGQK